MSKREMDVEEQQFLATLPRTRPKIESSCGTALGNPIIRSIVEAAPSASAVVKRMGDLGWDDAVRQARYCYYLKERFPSAWQEAGVIEPGDHPADVLFAWLPEPAANIRSVVWNNEGRHEEVSVGGDGSKAEVLFQDAVCMGDQHYDAGHLPLLLREMKVVLPNRKAFTTFDHGPEAWIYEADEWDVDEWSYLSPLSVYRTGHLQNFVSRGTDREQTNGWQLRSDGASSGSLSSWQHGIGLDYSSFWTPKTGQGFPHWYKQIEISQVPKCDDARGFVMNHIVLLLRTDLHPNVRGASFGKVMFERVIQMSCENRVHQRAAVVRTLYYIHDMRCLTPSWVEYDGRFPTEPSIYIDNLNLSAGTDFDHSRQVMEEACTLLLRFNKLGYTHNTAETRPLINDFLGEPVIKNPFDDLLDVFLSPRVD